MADTIPSVQVVTSALETLPSSTQIGLVSLLAFVAAFTAEQLGSSNLNTSELPMRYDKDKIAAFYRRYPDVVRKRLGSILYTSFGYLCGLLIDYISGNLWKNQSIRAKQLRELITELGPAYIKIGQAVSIRPDVCSPAYLTELQRLQDRVPPFGCDVRACVLSICFAVCMYTSTYVCRE
jgi:hypothetical protein